MTGTIKKIMGDGKRFGFISREGADKDLFFHESGLAAGVMFDSLKEGQEVSFNVKEGEAGGKGPSATEVTPV